MIQGITAKEAVNLGATSLTLYGRLFFPKTFRQKSPKFHEEIGRALYNPENRQVAVEVFRDGAKTTLLRVFTSQRVAYGISRTILFVSASQGHSILSLRWIKRQVEFNTNWANTFRLRKGSKWTDEVIEIWNDTIGATITIMALGITGQLRGFNIDDFRPDLIVCDDSSTDEMTSTAPQRKKYEDIFFGALINSLAPRSECPEAKAILLDTPKSKFDLIETCMADKAWVSLRYGVFDKEGESVWPARYPTAELRQVKEDYARTGRLPLWMREKECKIIAEELASFRSEHIKFWDMTPERMTTVLAIDPASSDSKDADDNVVAVLGFFKDDVYIVDYVAATGQTPEMVSKTVFEFIRRYAPLGLVVESIGYQRVLAWFLEKAMRENKTFLPVYQIQDKRRKADRIVQALGGRSAYGKLWCKASQIKFLEQFTEYSPTYGGHDDVLDAVAMGITWGTNQSAGDWLDGEYERIDETDVPKLSFRAAP
jgi:phage terminase large subunit-like protein